MLRNAPQMRHLEQPAATDAAIAETGAVEVPIAGPTQAIGNVPSAAGFAAMQSALKSSGGLLHADDLVCRWRDRRRGDYVSLARMIAVGEVCSFEWQRGQWLPVFQFDPHDYSVKQPVRMVQAELGHALRGWTLAAWFAQPNAWLADQRPADLVHLRPLKVLKAACGDRYRVAP